MKNILVFCASAAPHDARFTAAATQLGVHLAQQNCSLIYGGAQVGLMGTVANSVLQQGGKVIGIIPKFLQTKEVAHDALTEMIVVPTMHERKTKMYDRCDAAIVLPGGFGTMDELFEFLTWAQLGLHHKPIGIWNILGFYDALLLQLDKMVEAGLLSATNRGMLIAATALEDLFDKMKAYVPPAVPQWLADGGQ